MANLSTKFMGMDLKNPVIAGSSGITSTLEDIKELEQAGAAAVVLKSIFEEEIRMEMKKTGSAETGFPYAETMDFIKEGDCFSSLESYLDLIKSAKNETGIPVIGSINCVTAEEWIPFAKKIEDAGVDALELNILILPSDVNNTSEYTENKHLEIVNALKAEIRIPVAVKIGFHFSNLAGFISRLSQTEIDAIVMFNRSFNADFNITDFEVLSSNIFSTPGEIIHPLRWISIMSNRVSCDLAASTGVHDGKGVIKQLLAGASAVQIVSSLYKNGKNYVSIILDEINQWMHIKNVKNIAEIKGKMSYDAVQNPAAFERLQFMKYYCGK